MNFKKPTYVWYTLYTKVNCEKKVLTTLKEAKIECYLPFSKTFKQWSVSKKWIEEPMFPCYVFVRVSYLEFFKLLNIDGVLRYVSFGGHLQSIPDIQIRNIQTLIKEKQEEIVLIREHVSKGAKAEIIDGPLKGIQGEVVQICGKSRLVIRLESIGCCLYTNVLKTEIKFLKEAERDLELNSQTKFGKNLEKNKRLVL